MAIIEGTRRKQFSSCDFCRKSRIRCMVETPSAGSGNNSQCANCKHRKKRCTFEWLRSARPAGHTRQRSHAPSQLNSAARTPTISTNEPCHRSQPLNPLSDEQSFCGDGRLHASHPISPDSTTISGLRRRQSALETHKLLWSIFSSIFEPVFAIWLSPECCPYGGLSDRPTPMISLLAVHLDRLSCECQAELLTEATASAQCRRDCVEIDGIVRGALVAAVHCFSARWLPLVESSIQGSQDIEQLARDLWLNTRTALFKVVDRPCYQSILALYLFSMTPLPPGLESDDADSHLGEVFVQIALRQYHVVRAKRRNRHFSGSKIMAASPVSDSSRFSEEFLFSESLAYFGGVVIDTSTSLTLGRPSTLCAGILGFDNEPIFHLLRARTLMFHEKTVSWREDGITMMDEHQVISIAESAAAWKGYFWKAVSVLREAIVYGHGEREVANAQHAVLEALSRFQTTYVPLLYACEKGLLFLGQHARLHWYRLDLVPSLEQRHKESVSGVLNTVTFAMSIKVDFAKLPGTLPAVLGTNSQDPIEYGASLLSIDPYPHHVVASLQFVCDALLRYEDGGQITSETLQVLGSKILNALGELPQCSVSLQAARLEIQTKLQDRNGYARQPLQIPYPSLERRNETFDDPDTTFTVSDIGHAGLECLGTTLFAP